MMHSTPARASRWHGPADSLLNWAGKPTFQNPPLQIWFIGQAHRLLGEGDTAARFFSLVMALATLGMTYWIGKQLLGLPAALTAVALLLSTPLFVAGARGCMMEIPQAFWVSLAMVIAIGGRYHPNRLLLLALPIAAGLLTKSVLGLLPVLVLAAAALSTDYRVLWRTAHVWVGLAFGVLLGSSWMIHQYFTIGPSAVRAHVVGEIAERSVAGFDPLSLLFEYPLSS